MKKLVQEHPLLSAGLTAAASAIVAAVTDEVRPGQSLRQRLTNHDVPDPLGPVRDERGRFVSAEELKQRTGRGPLGDALRSSGLPAAAGRVANFARERPVLTGLAVTAGLGLLSALAPPVREKAAEATGAAADAAKAAGGWAAGAASSATHAAAGAAGLDGHGGGEDGSFADGEAVEASADGLMQRFNGPPTSGGHHPLDGRDELNESRNGRSAGASSQ